MLVLKDRIIEGIVGDLRMAERVCSRSVFWYKKYLKRAVQTRVMCHGHLRRIARRYFCIRVQMSARKWPKRAFLSSPESLGKWSACRSTCKRHDRFSSRPVVTVIEHVALRGNFLTSFSGICLFESWPTLCPEIVRNASSPSSKKVVFPLSPLSPPPGATALRGPVLPHIEGFVSVTHHSRQDSSGRVIGLTQREWC